MKIKYLTMCVSCALLVSESANATVWDEWNVANGSAESANYSGAYGSITFDDWGYSGPNGRLANNFSSVNGFGGTAEGNLADPTGGIGQIQHVITQVRDTITPDAPQTVYGDAGSTNVYTNANVDSTATFFQWAYTSPAGSTFNNMKIDYDGDYLINQNDMNFNFYNYFDYKQEGTTGGLADGKYYTKLAFKPYALSDATGWCGSVLTSHPNAIEAMAGQVTFDFAFDVYFQIAPGVLSYMSTEIVRDFKMRSYGDISLNVNLPGGAQVMSSRAVVNNTNPLDAAAVAAGLASGTAPSDPDYHNLVSFHGGDVVSSIAECGILTSAWAGGQRNNGLAEGANNGVKKFASLITATDATDCANQGGVWQGHSFGGYGFILRADGMRVVDFYDQSVYGLDPNLVNPVPVPAAVWLFGSGLIALAGVIRRKS